LVVPAFYILIAKERRAPARDLDVGHRDQTIYKAAGVL